ncbi:MAG UNVERIFIED_CONTAM: hypothetical protein LVR18_22695 [Planctomycetaceae bacterium]|jgi:hypothetical protein
MKAPRRKKTAFTPGTPPDCLPKALWPEFTELVARYESSGRSPNDVERIVLCRFVMAAEDLRLAEAEASEVPPIVETRSNGPQVHPAHKAVETRKRELRAWLKLLPKIAEPSPSRTSATPTASKTAPAAAATETAGPQPIRHELIARIRARIAALQASQPGGNPTTNDPAAVPTHNAAG